MAETFVPIYLDWTEVTEELNDQEKGRLIDAIVLYKAGGDWQDRIKGNERYLFPAFRKQMDRAARISEARASAGSAGGKQMQAKSSKIKQNEANTSKAPKEKEEEKEEEKDKEKDKGVTARARTRFTPPTVDDVQRYAQEKGYTAFNAEAFVTYYESKGWVVGRSPMKDWRAAVRGWVSRDNERSIPEVKGRGNPATQGFQERGYTDTDYGDDFFIDLAAINKEAGS